MFCFMNESEIDAAIRDKLAVVQYVREFDCQKCDDSAYLNLASKYPSISFYKTYINQDQAFETPVFVFYNLIGELCRLIHPKSFQEIEEGVKKLQPEKLPAISSPPRKKTKRSLGEITQADKDLKELELKYEVSCDDLIKFRQGTAAQTDSNRFDQPSVSTGTARLGSQSRSQSRSQLNQRADELEELEDEFDDELKSVSEMKISTVSRLTEINIRGLLAEEKHLVEDVIPLVDCPEDLLEKCYFAILKRISVFEYPVAGDLEKSRAKFIEFVLSEVLFYMKKKFPERFAELIVLERPSKSIQLGHLDKIVKPDYLVIGKNNDKESCYLIILEAKRTSCEEAVKQLIVYLKEMVYGDNEDGKPVYGLCCNGTFFNLLKYEPNKPPEESFKLLEVSRFVFCEMANHKEEWLTNHSLIVKILYSILLEKSEIQSV